MSKICGITKNGEEDESYRDYAKSSGSVIPRLVLLGVITGSDRPSL